MKAGRRLSEGGSRCGRCQEVYLRDKEARPPSFTERRGLGGWDWAQLREEVRERDGGCVRCGSTERLEVHHLTPLAEGGGNEPNNLATLCRRCHRLAHRR